jgi:hypothetical protein
MTHTLSGWGRLLRGRSGDSLPGFAKMLSHRAAALRMLPSHTHTRAQASLGAINLPTERLGYTYTVCAAGGSLSWDHFANADAVGMKQSLTPDLKRLTRVSCLEGGGGGQKQRMEGVGLHSVSHIRSLP